MTLDLPSIPDIKAFLWSLQKELYAGLIHRDPKSQHRQDAWTSHLGTGISCIVEEGDFFEKAGVNVSHVSGMCLPEAATQKRPELAGCAFEALGLSLVFHPRNPYVPTTHANIRFFMASNKLNESTWWFGGGFDLTPYYGFYEDGVHWHQMAKQACDPFGLALYPTFKKACDEYFYLPHRQEARGIGGLFFDDFNEKSFEHSFNFLKSVGHHFIQGYFPIFEKRMHLPFGEREKAFQHYRRGRYVEFNLLYDRGTLFGLQSKGRIESILMSLPPRVSWVYDWQPEPGSAEAKLYTDFLPAREWIIE